jgi:3',5'-cyclic AMP phosphodiesterase CpdA
VVVLGDSGANSPAQHAIARRLAETPFELMLFLGDIAYTHGTRRQLQTRFFDVYRRYLLHTPAFPALGNHDVRSRGGRAYVDSFVLPGNERWYSFDWGDVHFVALDTTRIGREQTEWLEDDLARNRQKWVVVFGHHPPASSGWRGGSARFQRFFMPVLRRHRVDLLLTGHEHHYERINLGGGMHLVISGGGGAGLRSTVFGARPARLVVVHHFVTLAITKDELKLRAIDIDGREIDRLKLEK